MHWLAKRFMRINQIILDEKLILCCHCEEYLGTTIWNTPDGKNTCDDCKESTKCFTYNQNTTLELALREFKYPCSSPSECHFIDTFEKAKEHSKTCQSSFKCNYCDSIVNIDNTIDHYLEQHCKKKLFASHEAFFNKIVLILPLKTEEKQRIHILRSGYTDFILFINIIAENKCSVGIAKHQDFLCPQFNRATQDEFVIEWKNKETKEERKLKGETSTIHDYFAGKSKQAMMTLSTLMNKKQRIELTIAFNDFKSARGLIKTLKALNAKMENVSCPVCFADDKYLFQTKRCKNNHILCSKCTALINACPFCREPMDIPLELTQQLPNLVKAFEDMKCINTHCLKVIREDHLADHTKNCAFEEVECPECDPIPFVMLPRMKLLGHLQTSHKKFLQSHEFYVPSKVMNRQHYLVFKGHLFALTVSVLDVEGERTVCFMMRLLMEEDTQPDAFRYELHLHEKPSDIIATMKLGNVCQDETDTVVNVMLKASSMPRVQGDDESLGFFRVYIFNTERAASVEKPAVKAIRWSKKLQPILRIVR